LSNDGPTRFAREAITRIEGRIIGHDNVFRRRGPPARAGLGTTWPTTTRRPVGGLDFNENVVRLSFAPGSTRGDPVIVTAKPEAAALRSKPPSPRLPRVAKPTSASGGGQAAADSP